MKNHANILLALASVVITLIMIEAILRIAQPGMSTRYAVWPPGLDQLIVPDARDTPGISESHHFQITAQGYRGRPIGDARLRIAAFGGSTTESLFVPEERSWPRLIEPRLAATVGVPTWVGNFGKSGRNTRQHILDAKYVLPEFPAQIALFLVGVNDLGLALTELKTDKPISLEEIVSDAYVKKSLIVAENEPVRIRLLSLVGDTVRVIARRPADAPKTELPHITTDFYRHYRRLRAERAGFTSATPDLTSWLNEYARNLSLIADLVQARSVLPVFISQPAMWSSALPDAVEALFWWGPVEGLDGGSGKMYYDSQAMDRMMTAFNERLRIITREKNVPLIDLARTLPKDPAYFYDEMHYNEAGSRAVAEIVARDLAAIVAERGLGAQK